MWLHDVAPYQMDPQAKQEFLVARLHELLEHHAARCPAYARLVDDWRSHRSSMPFKLEDYPFIPVDVFKEYALISTTDEVMNIQSSATTSTNASRIYVDRLTRSRQTMSATKLFGDFIGEERRPYLVFDLEKTVRGADSLSARGAAILAVAHLASEFHFVMIEDDDGLRIDEGQFRRALERIGGRPFIAYGFTYVLYQAHLQLALGSKLTAHPASVFLHSGGWKRLERIAVDKEVFSRAICDVWNLQPDRVIDFYGSVEQVGVPYPDCSEGLKHVPYWADVVIRRTDTLQPAGLAEDGLIQLINCLPVSAPNHSVLTEDLGQIRVLDGCPCGRRDKGFVFRGRMPHAEVRGCSDVARH